MIDANGVVTNMRYDARQRLTLTCRSVGVSTETCNINITGRGSLHSSHKRMVVRSAYYDSAHHDKLDATRNHIAENLRFVWYIDAQLEPLL